MSDGRFKAYVAVYAVLIDDGKILLIRRYNTGYKDGEYALPSGHLDGAESARVGAAREAKEEVGVNIDEDDMEIVHLLHRYRPEREYIDIYVKADKWKGEPQNMEPNKCDEVTWFKLDDLPENTVKDVRQAIENIKLGVFYSEFGF